MPRPMSPRRRADRPARPSDATPPGRSEAIRAAASRAIADLVAGREDRALRRLRAAIALARLAELRRPDVPGAQTAPSAREVERRLLDLMAEDARPKAGS